MLEGWHHSSHPCLSLPWFSPINIRETRREKKKRRRGRGIQKEKGQTEERRTKKKKNYSDPQFFNFGLIFLIFLFHHLRLDYRALNFIFFFLSYL